MARTPKLTPEVEERILLSLRAGNFLKVAAASAGISEATLHRWLTDKRPVYRAFGEASRRAEAEGEVLLVGRIGQAVKKSPGTVLKLLERWGRARADLTQPPDEFPAEPLEPGPPKPLTLSDRFISVSEEWMWPISKLFTAAALGHTPAEFFEGPDRLASLRDSYPPPDPWWKVSGEATHPDTSRCAPRR